MAPTATVNEAQERHLLEAARRGDQDAYARLLEPYRGELHAHCYRMLGSFQDAEDALQDASLRAWKALKRFEGRSALRSWLYTIATNTCLTQISKRPKQRVLPLDYGPAADPHEMPGRPIVESVWIEPYPDHEIGIGEGPAGPEARFEQRESVELAFVAAVQHLPATQRAVLILREVLGFSAAEVAEALETTVASINSALQRARKTIDDKLPERSQQATLRAVDDDELRETVERFMAAMDREDVDEVVSMLAQDAAWSMPPLATWYLGHDAIRDFLQVGPLVGRWRWKRLHAHANGQPAIGVYTYSDEAGCFLPFALDVLTMDGLVIKEVCSFIARSPDVPDPKMVERYPDLPPDAAQVASVFQSFGLPTRIA